MEKETHPILDNLIKKGKIKSYSLTDEEEFPNSGMREYQKLVITFDDNQELILSTFCLGSMGNTVLLISEKEEL